MHSQSAYFVLSTLALAVNAVPEPWHLVARQSVNTTVDANGTAIYPPPNSTVPASLPQQDSNAKLRAAAVAVRNQGFVYGPSLIGEAAPFPNGTLGNARSAYDMDLWAVDREIIDNDMEADVAVLEKAIMANGGLKSLDDYANVLYGNEWKNAVPGGELPGIMTNYTQDLLFSMERLSSNPYPLELVQANATLPFQVPSNLTTAITGTSLEALQANGSLFVVDHSYQNELEKTTIAPARYGAACTAYFFIHPQSGDFLPLAIKTNAGSDLIYTPLDSPTDWLLAKMIFNVNDMFHAQMFHLTITHDVAEGLHLAALRNLGENHPIMIVLERLMTQGYSSRIVGEELCFNPGGHWDQLFYVNNVGCRDFVTNNWPTRAAFQTSYLQTDFQTRGLIDAKGEYKFKSFPFFQDASEIHDAYNKFFTSFVNSYYTADADVAADYELQNWVKDVSTGAKVHGFPAAEEMTKDVLVDVLTHFGFIVSVVHHSLNGGSGSSSKATLPFHLNALYAPLPEAKGVTDLLPFLPPAPDAVQYLGFLATFNRPFYPSENRTAEYAFTDAAMLARFNKDVAGAAATFQSSMASLSTEINARTFDAQGLSMGMPFIYKILDPGYIPYFSAV